MASQRSDYGPVVVRLEMEFKKQVIYPAVLDVTIGLLNLQSRSFSFGCTMWKEEQLVYLAAGDFYWINFSTGKIVSLPEEFIEKFKPFIIKEQVK